jgi:hypothetical protein
VERARLFEVALPLPPVQGGASAEGGGGSSTTTASERDELAGVGLAFYAQVFALEVRLYYAACAAKRRLPHTYVSVSPPLAPAAAQGCKMRDEEDDQYVDNPDHDGGIRTAVRAWFEDPAAAKARYGPIASWDVSEVTDLSYLFEDQADFNGDLSRWNVSSVVHMDGMFEDATSYNGDLSSWNVSNVKHMGCLFYGATSFDGDLDGAWATSTAGKHMMFHNSPGTIAGKTKDANGTIV